MVVLTYLLIFSTFLVTSALGYLSPPPVDFDVVPEEYYFDQKLDHFNPTDERSWRQRFFVNNTFFRPGGPAFLMIGGEGPASVNWMAAGAWMDYAREFGAAMIQLEHRYYGQSHPTKDISTENLVYLSSEQALADIAYFVTVINESLRVKKWIAFGGSYPGSLATWVRLKYPHLIYASVASSAPLVAQVDFKEYLEVIDDSLKFYGGDECPLNIKKAFRQIDLYMEHQDGWNVLDKLFKLCTPLNASNTLDRSNFFELLTENFNDIVQYNRDNRAFEGARTANITIETLCAIMNNASVKSEVERLAQVNSLVMKANDAECFEPSYSSMIDILRDISWANNSEPGGRQWIYQTCTEFGFYQSSDSTSQPFGSEFPLKFFVDQCKDIFGSKFTSNLLNHSIVRTNFMYGGRRPKVTRVVFVNGSIDPWHKLGLVADLNKSSPAFFINGTAHCANMYPPSSSDLPQLVAARKSIRTHIQQWMGE